MNRKSIYVLALFLGSMSPALAESPPAKVIIIVLAKDRAKAVDIEKQLQDNFSKRSIDSAVIDKMGLSQTEVPSARAQLRAQGYNRLLCIAPRPSVSWDEAKAESSATIEACLTAYGTGEFQHGDPVDVDPVATAPVPYGMGTASSNPALSDMIVYKGVMRWFDMNSGQLLWKKKPNVKVAKDMRTDRRVREVSDALWKELVDAGF